MNGREPAARPAASVRGAGRRTPRRARAHRLWSWATATLAGLVFGGGRPALEPRATPSRSGPEAARASRRPTTRVPGARLVRRSPGRSAGGSEPLVVTAAVAARRHRGALGVVLGARRTRGPPRRGRGARSLRSLHVRGPSRGPHHARPARPSAHRRRARPVRPRRRADAVGQDDRPRHPCAVGVAGPGAGDERQDRPVARHDRRAPGRRSRPALRPGRRDADWTASSWSPLDGCADWAIARRTAAWLAEGASSGQARACRTPTSGTRPPPSSWRPVLFAAARAGASMADVVTWLDTQAEGTVIELLEATRRPARAQRDAGLRHARRAAALVDLHDRRDDPRGLRRPARARPLGRRTTSIVDAFLDGGSHTLYLSSTVREQRRLRPLFVALIQAVVQGRTNGPRRPAARSTLRCSSCSTRRPTSRPFPTSTSSRPRASARASSCSRSSRTSRRRTTDGVATGPTRSSTTTARRSSAPARPTRERSTGSHDSSATRNSTSSRPRQATAATP